jgi:hypothetical protein
MNILFILLQMNILFLICNLFVLDILISNKLWIFIFLLQRNILRLILNHTHKWYIYIYVYPLQYGRVSFYPSAKK